MFPSGRPAPTRGRLFHFPGACIRWHTSSACRRCPANGSSRRTRHWALSGTVGCTTGWVSFGTPTYSDRLASRRAKGSSQDQPTSTRCIVSSVRRCMCQTNERQDNVLSTSVSGTHVCKFVSGGHAARSQRRPFLGGKHAHRSGPEDACNSRQHPSKNNLLQRDVHAQRDGTLHGPCSIAGPMPRGDSRRLEH